jgi:hypothetical protein
MKKRNAEVTLVVNHGRLRGPRPKRRIACVPRSTREVGYRRAQRVFHVPHTAPRGLVNPPVLCFVRGMRAAIAEKLIVD